MSLRPYGSQGAPGHTFGRRHVAAATQRHAGHLPDTPRKHLQRLAIDLRRIPYLGKATRHMNEIYRRQNEACTSRSMPTPQPA